jgi:hypothetical protein
LNKKIVAAALIGIGAAVASYLLYRNWPTSLANTPTIPLLPMNDTVSSVSSTQQNLIPQLISTGPVLLSSLQVQAQVFPISATQVSTNLSQSFCPKTETTNSTSFDVKPQTLIPIEHPVCPVNNFTNISQPFCSKTNQTITEKPTDSAYLSSVANVTNSVVSCAGNAIASLPGAVISRVISMPKLIYSLSPLYRVVRATGNAVMAPIHMIPKILKPIIWLGNTSVGRVCTDIFVAAMVVKDWDLWFGVPNRQPVN